MYYEITQKHVFSKGFSTLLTDFLTKPQQPCLKHPTKLYYSFYADGEPDRQKSESINIQFLVLKHYQSYRIPLNMVRQIFTIQIHPMTSYL